MTTTTVAPGTFPDLTFPTRDPDQNLTLTAGESAGDSTGTSNPFGQIFIGFVFVVSLLDRPEADVVRHPIRVRGFGPRSTHCTA